MLIFVSSKTITSRLVFLLNCFTKNRVKETNFVLKRTNFQIPYDLVKIIDFRLSGVTEFNYNSDNPQFGYHIRNR